MQFYWSQALNPESFQVLTFDQEVHPYIHWSLKKLPLNYLLGRSHLETKVVGCLAFIPDQSIYHAPSIYYYSDW